MTNAAEREPRLFRFECTRELVLDEDGSNLAAALWNGCDAALSSRLAYPEVCAALAAAVRNRDLSASQAREANTDWEVFWASMRPVELSADVGRASGELARRHGLRGAEAVHLASALALDTTDLVVAVWDRRLHAGAAAAGLATAPRKWSDASAPDRANRATSIPCHQNPAVRR